MACQPQNLDKVGKVGAAVVEHLRQKRLEIAGAWWWRRGVAERSWGACEGTTGVASHSKELLESRGERTQRRELQKEVSQGQKLDNHLGEREEGTRLRAHS